jgi:hypothetical protein
MPELDDTKPTRTVSPGTSVELPGGKIHTFTKPTMVTEKAYRYIETHLVKKVKANKRVVKFMNKQENARAMIRNKVAKGKVKRAISKASKKAGRK